MCYMWYLINYTLARNLSPCCKRNDDARTFFFDTTVGRHSKVKYFVATIVITLMGFYIRQHLD